MKVSRREKDGLVSPESPLLPRVAGAGVTLCGASWLHTSLL